MELPDLGVHCAVTTCNQLDFLPVKCDACKSRYCNDHWTYDAHTCPQKHTRNVQVPVCPLCDKPVPTPKGTSPDATVSAHLDRDCQEKARRKTKNKCSLKKCKQTEFIKVSCERCHQNFCLKHRHPTDHECQGPIARQGGQASSRAAQAAMARQQQQTGQPSSRAAQAAMAREQAATPSVGTSVRAAAANTSNRIANMFQQQQQRQAQAVGGGGSALSNGQLSEDEAIARAMQASLNDGQPQQQITAPRTQEEQDRMLAQALAESEREANRQQGSSSQDASSKSCGIS